MARIERETVDLDYDATLAFFRERAERGRALGHVGATGYQDQDPELALRRDAVEKERVLPLLTSSARLRVLDLGCGSGRWADELHESVDAYLGIDYASELLALGRQRFGEAHPRVRFQQLSVTELGKKPLAVPPPFDRILISGLCIYLNDADLAGMLAALPALASPAARIYVREPVSLLAHRLTLKEHYSEELDAEYNAIYRTADELCQLFQAELAPARFTESTQDVLYPPELNNRRETRQHFFVWERAER